MSSPQRIWVGLGEAALTIGHLDRFEQSGRVFSRFTHHPGWLSHPRAFSVSPELGLAAVSHLHKPRAAGDASVFFALADTLPGAWARRILSCARSVALEPDKQPTVQPLHEMDLLLAVNDHARLGALRVMADAGGHRPHPGPSWWPHPVHAPPIGLSELPRAAAACWAVEVGRFLSSDLPFLMTHGVSLGGARPKATVCGDDGELYIAKFSEMRETMVFVVLAEVLTLRLAAQAGIEAPNAQVWRNERGVPVALIRRFDRTRGADQGLKRSPYVSANTLMQASVRETLTVLDVLKAMSRHCKDPEHQARQLWLRLVFRRLIGQHAPDVHKTGFVFAGHDRWSLAPVFGLRPTLGEAQSMQSPIRLKTAAGRPGPVASLQYLLDHVDRFGHTRLTARAALDQAIDAIRGWRKVASAPDLDMSRMEQGVWAPAFDSPRLEEAKQAFG